MTRSITVIRWTFLALLTVTAAACARFQDNKASKAVPPTPPPAAPAPAEPTTPPAVPEAPKSEPTGPAQEGKASYYGAEFEGKKTASGEIFDKEKKTAAHNTLPLGTKAKVTNKETGESVEVEITDRGPNVDGRIVDLSEGAAKEIGMTEEGVQDVKVEPVKPAK